MVFSLYCLSLYPSLTINTSDYGKEKDQEGKDKERLLALDQIRGCLIKHPLKLWTSSQGIIKACLFAINWDFTFEME